MKIKFENILDKVLAKLNLERKSKGKVIKFEETKKEEIIRKGAIKDNNKSDKKVYKQGVKILASMILLLLLTISLTLNSKNTVSDIVVENKVSSAIATSSSVDTTNDNEENIVFASKYTPVVEEKLVFSKPLDGEIQKMYSTDKVIYSKTLEQWKTHDGLDISATTSSEVKAIEKGVVIDIYNDSFYGVTIVIEHISGYKSQYSNLDENVYVSIGESVIKGQKIGKVGNTSVGEYLDDLHLHFMVFLNDNSIDPTYIYD